MRVKGSATLDRGVMRCSECNGEMQIPFKWCSVPCKEAAHKRYEAQRELQGLSELNSQLRRLASEHNATS